MCVCKRGCCYPTVNVVEYGSVYRSGLGKFPALGFGSERLNILVYYPTVKVVAEYGSVYGSGLGKFSSPRFWVREVKYILLLKMSISSKANTEMATSMMKNVCGKTKQQNGIKQTNKTTNKNYSLDLI